MFLNLLTFYTAKIRIFDNNSLGSYYKFLVKYEKEYTIRLSEDEEKAIEFISKKLASGKRIHELELLKRTLQYHHGIIGHLQKKTKTFPIFINYDKQDNISDTTKYEDHFVAENRLIAISKSGRSMDSEDVQNFLNATERGIDVQLFVRKNKDDKISKEFYYLGRVIATGNAKQFVMPNTDKTAVEIEWELETPVREDIYQYIVNE